MKNRMVLVLFNLVICLLASSLLSVDELSGNFEFKVEVYANASGGEMLWAKDFGVTHFRNGNPDIDPIRYIFEQDFGRDIVYAQYVIDGESLSSDRIAVRMVSSLRREFDSMDMGVEIGEVGNDVGIRSDRLIIGAGDPNEKVTVEGAISIEETPTAPHGFAGYGKIYVDSGDSELYFVRSDGSTEILSIDDAGSGAAGILSIEGSDRDSAMIGRIRLEPGEGTEITETMEGDTGVIVVRFTGNCGSGCTSAPSIPTSVDGASTICSGEPGACYAVAPVDGANYYRWTLPSGSVVVDGLGSNSIRAVFGNLDGNVCVTAVNPCGESSPRCKAVTINRPTSPGPISGDALVCNGAMGKSYFIATVPDASNYIWTLPAGAVLASGTGSPSITVNFGALGGDICVQTENSCGISSPVCLPITITDTPETPGAITGLNSVCGGATGVSYSIDAVAEATSYSWTVPSGASISAGAGTRSISVNFGTTSGNISVTASSICGTSAPRTMAVTVTNIPSTPGTIAGSSTVPPNTNDEAYSITPVSGATSYLWSVTGDAVIDGSATGSSINVDFGSSSGTTVNICVSAGNSCGSSSDRCKTVTIAAPSGSVTFNYIGSSQTWSVPAGVTSVDVDAYGASGYGGSGGIPGSGGRVQATVPVTPGETFYIYVGGQGTSCSGGGWNGGGSTSCSYSYSGRGGGASDIRRGGTSLGNRIIVAGGGGGSGYNWGSSPSDNGGHGGGLTGGRNGSCPVPGAPGYGGTQSAGGAGGVYGSGYSNGSPGSLGNGGNGATGTGGGGGGGGYYGGGGGSWSGGGGGSSYTVSGSSGVVHTQGARTGNGQIIISW